MRRSLLALLMLCCVPGLPMTEAQAQTPMISSAPPPEHRVGLALGWDPIWMMGLGYAHRGPLLGRHPTQIEASLVLPVALIPGFDGARLEGGMSLLLATPSGLGTTVGLSSGLTLADDSLGTHLGWGLALSVRPGYYATRWSIALDLGYRTALSTYVAHSDAVEDLFAERYPDGGGAEGIEGPKDGFYAFSAHRLRLGLLAGLRAGEHVGLFLVAGLEHTPQSQGLIGYAPVMAVPFYAQLGGDYRW